MIKEYFYQKIEFAISQLGFIGMVSLGSSFFNTVLNNTVSLVFALLLFFITRYAKAKWPDHTKKPKK